MKSCVIAVQLTEMCPFDLGRPRRMFGVCWPSWASKGEFVEAHRRSSRRDDWSWHRQCIAKIQPTNSRGSTEISNRTLQRRPPTPDLQVPAAPALLFPKECFFCGDGDKPNEVLHRVSTTWSANRIIEAVHNGTNSEWKIQLPPDLDVLAADVMYHKGCWSIHVVNKLRTVASTQQEPEDRSVIEFVEEVSEKLESGVVLSMGEIDSIKEQHGLAAHAVSRPGRRWSWKKNNPRTEKGASIVGQVLMTNILSAKQAATSTQASRTRETPLQVATALAIHQETRSKAMIKMFHGAGLAISYSSLLRLEASLARTVLSAGRRDGVFIPRRLEKGLLVHFAIDNIDFQEDTVDGKGTFHGTVSVAFQPGPSSPSELEPLKLSCRCQRLQTPCSELCDCSPEMCINDEEDGHEDVDGVDD
ncbi:hypothetical protein GWK47_020548 [Chionoecetes opilio]|uniref:Uncharacterized protein n=1 Tax=Chionoecetes opilio TaxID=41210 RepID=A0A8J4XP53_CHIOP|nr:hypothetical protein GWK47_020548 [Chionoecetes opilio]